MGGNSIRHKNRAKPSVWYNYVARVKPYVDEAEPTTALGHSRYIDSATLELFEHYNDALSRFNELNDEDEDKCYTLGNISPSSKCAQSS